MMVQQWRSLDASKAQKNLCPFAGNTDRLGLAGKRKEKRIDTERLILSIKASG
jgi:hypothetical protein